MNSVRRLLGSDTMCDVITASGELEETYLYGYEL